VAPPEFRARRARRGREHPGHGALSLDLLRRRRHDRGHVHAAQPMGHALLGSHRALPDHVVRRRPHRGASPASVGRAVLLRASWLAKALAGTSGGASRDFWVTDTESAFIARARRRGAEINIRSVRLAVCYQRARQVLSPHWRARPAGQSDVGHCTRYATFIGDATTTARRIVCNMNRNTDATLDNSGGITVAHLASRLRAQGRLGRV
jgi:hypothetical protein